MPFTAHSCCSTVVSIRKKAEYSSKRYSLYLIVLILIGLYEGISFWLCTVGDILGENKLQGPVMYSFKELKSGTRSFSDDSKIGEGGYGDVYKVSLVLYSFLPDTKLILCTIIIF